MIGWEWRRAMGWASFSRKEDHDPAPTVSVTPLGGSTRRGCARGSRDGSAGRDRKSTRLNSSHGYISYAVFCLKKKKKNITSIVTIARYNSSRTHIAVRLGQM